MKNLHLHQQTDLDKIQLRNKAMHIVFNKMQGFNYCEEVTV